MLVEWFSPGYKAGGPIRSCVNMCLLLRRQYDIFVITTNQDHGDTSPYPNIESDKWLSNTMADITIYYASPNLLNRKLLKQLIDFIAPQYIYTQLLFSPLFAIYPAWLAYTGKLSAKLILCPRGTLYKSALAVKPLPKKLLLKMYRWFNISKAITFHATSSQEADAIRHFFPGSKLLTAPNLPDLQQLPLAPIPKKSGQLKCIFVARIVPIKNLLFLLEILQGLAHTIELTIAGPAEDEAYWAHCKKCIGSMPSNILVKYIGPQPAAALPKWLQQHHLFVLPTTGENFGHAIFEALAAGRPVLISDQTPWQDLEANSCGWHVPLLQKDRFVAVLNQVADADQIAYDKLSCNAWEYAMHYINKSDIAQPYLQLFS
jgi:glycosyltransferase involved in cell wall biosynthesis